MANQKYKMIRVAIQIHKKLVELKIKTGVPLTQLITNAFNKKSFSDKK